MLAGSGDSRPSASQVATLSGIVRDSSGKSGRHGMSSVLPCGWDEVWVNYNELTTSSLEIIVSKGNHPQMALIQVSELL